LPAPPAGGQRLLIDGLHQRFEGLPLLLLVTHVIEGVQASGNLRGPGSDFLPDDEPWATPLAWSTRRGHGRITEILRGTDATA
jgi:hypothetical protein